jgi:predicted transcriptional regulator of viral defense system
MKLNLRSLGPKEAQVVLSLSEQGRNVVRAADIIDLLQSESTARKVIRNLLRKGWLSRLVGGKYLFLPPDRGPENLGENNAFALATAVVEPCYVGWWSAAAFHGLTTQKPMTAFVAVMKQTAARRIEGTELRFVSVAARKFFGFQSYDVYGRSVPISTPEKTVIDCIDRPDLCGGLTELIRIVYGAHNEMKAATLVQTAVSMKSTALLQRLGFLFDLVEWVLPAADRARLRSAIPRSRRISLGRACRKTGDVGYVAGWGVIVNESRDSLLADVPGLRSRRKDRC